MGSNLVDQSQSKASDKMVDQVSGSSVKFGEQAGSFRAQQVPVRTRVSPLHVDAHEPTPLLQFVEDLCCPRWGRERHLTWKELSGDVVAGAGLRFAYKAQEAMYGRGLS